MPLCRPKCYPTHIPTSSWEKAFLTIGAGIAALKNPYRDDMVAVVGETTSLGVVQRLRMNMLSHPTGRQILKDRPLITSQTVPLRSYPIGSLGESYVQYMTNHGFDSDLRAPVHFVEDPEQAYVLTRYRQIHDFLHVLMGLPATVQGEWGLKWFEACHFGLPMPFLATVFGAPRFAPSKPWRYLKWGLHGRQTPLCLLNVYFEHQLDTDLDDLRKELKVCPAPSLID